MFPFITKTWNPIGGKCPHDCSYCWAKDLSKRYDMSKYQGPTRLYPKELKRTFKDSDFVFVQDMSDLFANTTPNGVIEQVFNRIREYPKTKFLLLTKNPMKYHDFIIPNNTICGATIETDIVYSKKLSRAPKVTNRIYAMRELKHKKMVAIEPIIQFSPYFLPLLRGINPEFVAIGYDNYNNGLQEPKLSITEILISGLEVSGIRVYKKTLRDPK